MRRARRSNKVDDEVVRLEIYLVDIRSCAKSNRAGRDRTSRDPLFFRSWSHDEWSDMERQERRRSLTTFGCDRSPSHLPRSRSSTTILFPGGDTCRYGGVRCTWGEKAQHTPTSRRYGVAADTNRRRDARALSDTIFHACARPPRNRPAGAAGATRGATWGATGRPAARRGNPLRPLWE